MMKKLIILSSLATIVIVAALLFIVTSHPKGALKYKPIGLNIFSKEGKKGEIDGAVKYLAEIKNNQITKRLEMSDVNRAIEQILRLPQAKANKVEWKEMGPDNIGGRTRSIFFDIRDPNLQTLYAGAVSGGLWKSTTGGSSWFRVPLTQKNGNIFSNFENININCMAQGPDSTIYLGTGEQLANAYGTGTITSTGFQGNGIYYSIKSKKNIDSFVYLPSTKGNANFQFVNKIVVNTKSKYIYAATGNGLFVSKDKGTIWTYAIKSGSTPVTGGCTEVKIASDQTTIITANTTTTQEGVVETFCYVSTDGGTTFVKKTALPSTNIRRIEFAFAPSDPNYVYAQLANTSGHLAGIYRSKDKGNTWSLIGPGDSKIFIMFGANGQGWYDNVIAVFPDNPNRILAAGVTLYEWQEGKTWVEKTGGVSVHSDIHAIVFHPKNPKIYYIGTDGGVYRTRDAGETYESLNLNYSVTQFYAMANSGTDEVMGGTQDNGTPYINHKYNTDRGAYQVGGGDGGWCSFSLINPSALYLSIYYSTVLRTPDKTTGYAWQAPTDWYGGNFKNKWGMLSYGEDTNKDGTPDNYGTTFVTKCLMWETFNDNFSKENVSFKADKDYVKGDIITLRSNNNSFPFDYTIQSALPKDSTIKIKDKIQSRFFIAMNTILGNSIWMTKGAADFSRTPQWYKIAGSDIQGGAISTLSISKDGNHLFVGTNGGSIYRISNLRFAYDSLTAESRYKVTSFTKLTNSEADGRVIASISVDPRNAAHIIVSLGNYGNSRYIYESKNALDLEPTFALKQGNLPYMPAYSSLIEMNNSKVVFVGTEYGVYKTDNIDASEPVWEEQNIGMERVPTFMLRQQIYKYDGDYAPTGSTPPYTRIKENAGKQNVTNYGVIYAATYGRGIFKTSEYSVQVGINENMVKDNQTGLNVYPNPVKDNLNIAFTLSSSSNVLISVYDMNGKRVKNVNLTDLHIGPNKATINVSDIAKGTYIINLIAGKESASSKVVILK